MPYSILYNVLTRIGIPKKAKNENWPLLREIKGVGMLRVLNPFLMSDGGNDSVFTTFLFDLSLA